MHDTSKLKVEGSSEIPTRVAQLTLILNVTTVQFSYVLKCTYCTYCTYRKFQMRNEPRVVKSSVTKVAEISIRLVAQATHCTGTGTLLVSTRSGEKLLMATSLS